MSSALPACRGTATRCSRRTGPGRSARAHRATRRSCRQRGRARRRASTREGAGRRNATTWKLSWSEAWAVGDRAFHPGSAENEFGLSHGAWDGGIDAHCRRATTDVLSKITRAADPPAARQRRRCMSASPQSQSPGTPGQPDVTALLLAWGAGDRAALDALVPAVYAALRIQAAKALRREAEGHTLSTTALVHEAYLRLVDQSRVRIESRSHFYGIAARVMRRILVDHARARSAAKRGGQAGAATHPVTLRDADTTGEPAAEVLA